MAPTKGDGRKERKKAAVAEWSKRKWRGWKRGFGVVPNFPSFRGSAKSTNNEKQKKGALGNERIKGPLRQAP